MNREKTASGGLMQSRTARLVAWVVTLALVLAALSMVPRGVKVKSVVEQPDNRFVRDTQIPANLLVASQPDLPLVWNHGGGGGDTMEPYFTVCIDPGHGGNDGGCADGSRLEKVDNLAMALSLQAALEKRGVKVVMTRSDDVYVELQERSKIANDSGAHYFISLHRNQCPGAEGVETWMSANGKTSETEGLAKAVQNALVTVGVNRDRGVRIGSQGGGVEYYVLRTTEMPAVLVELGFVDNSDDNAVFDQNREEYAEEVADAIVGVYDKYHGEEADT